MRRESQSSIAKWAEATFGPVADHSVLVKRAMVEMQELFEAAQAGDVPEMGREAADIAILLYRLMAINGLDLNDEVTEKMAINRARQWHAKGDGTGSHIKG